MAEEFVYPDITPPSPPAGSQVIFACDDLYTDEKTKTAWPNEPYLYVKSGVNGSRIAYLRFHIAGLGNIMQAKLRMYCVDYSMDGNYLPIKITQWETGWNEASPEYCTYAHMNGTTVETMYNNIYACPQLSIGSFEIDITEIVNVAKHDRADGDYLSFKIECYQNPLNRELFVTFASAQAPTQFTPHLVITPEPTELETLQVQASQDCFTSSERPENTPGDPLHVPPILPCINYGFTAYPVNSGANDVFWAFFSLINVRAARSVTLNFWITDDSTFTHDVTTYYLAIMGHTFVFDETSFDYNYIQAHLGDQDAGRYFKALPIIVSEYEGQTKKVTVDITEIFRHCMIRNGLLISIGSEENTTDTIYIGGRADAPAYLEFTLEPEYPYPNELQDLQGSDGRVILYPELDAEQQLPENALGYSFAVQYSYGSSRNFALYFDFHGIPFEAFSKLDMAVLRLPFLGWDKVSSQGAQDMYLIDYHGENNYHWYMDIVDGNDDWVVNMPYPYYRPNIVLSTSGGNYIDIDIRFLLWDATKYSLLIDEAHPDYRLKIWGFDPFDDTEYGILHDGLRFGTRAGYFPPYIELRWDDYGIDYFAHARLGLDTNNGMSPTTQWRTWDHAVKNTPAGSMLYVTENFVTEPPNNQGGFTNDLITVHESAQYYYGYLHSDVESNTGTPYYPTSVRADKTNADGTYSVEYNEPPNSDPSFKYVDLTFDISSLHKPVFKAVLFWFVPYADEQGSYNAKENMFSSVALYDGERYIDYYSHEPKGWGWHMPNPSNPFPAIAHYWWKMDVTQFVNKALLQDVTSPTFRVGLTDYANIYEAYHKFSMAPVSDAAFKPVLLVHNDIYYRRAPLAFTAEAGIFVDKIYLKAGKAGTLGNVAIEDTYYSMYSPENGVVHGNYNYIIVSSNERGMLKFDITNLGHATTATLHLIPIEKTYPDVIGSTSMPLYHGISWYSNDWAEATLTYVNTTASRIGDSYSSVRVPTPIPEEITVDVTAMFNAAVDASYTEFTLHIQQNAPCWSNGAYYVKYGTKESGQPAYLTFT